MNSNTVIISGVAVVGAIILYEIGKKIQEDQGEGPGNYQAGGKWVNPNWIPHDPIKKPYQPGGNVKVPSCERWDETLQLFVNAGSPALDESPQACFDALSQNDIPRYVNKDFTVSFEAQNPLSSDPSEWGTCYFRNSDGSFSRFPAGAIVNQSDRLCFAAGQSLGTQGAYFTTNAGFTTYNPNYSYWSPDISSVKPAANLMIYDRIPIVPTSSSYCEELVGLDNYAGQIWAHTNYSSRFDGNAQGCVAVSDPFTQRYSQNGTLVYQNPYDKSMIQTQRLV